MSNFDPVFGPFAFLALAVVLGGIYLVLARSATYSASLTPERRLSIVLALGAIAYVYRQVMALGWIALPLALLAGVLIVLLGEAILEEREEGGNSKS